MIGPCDNFWHLTARVHMCDTVKLAIVVAWHWSNCFQQCMYMSNIVIGVGISFIKNIENSSIYIGVSAREML